MMQHRHRPGCCPTTDQVRWFGCAGRSLSQATAKGLRVKIRQVLFLIETDPL